MKGKLGLSLFAAMLLIGALILVRRPPVPKVSVQEAPDGAVLLPSVSREINANAPAVSSTLPDTDVMAREANRRLEDLRSRHAEARRAPKQRSYLKGFSVLSRLHYHEARCWARAFPHLAETWASGVVGGFSASDEDMYLAMSVLSALVENGSRSAAKALADLGNRSSTYSRAAVAWLAEADSNGLQGQVIRDFAVRGHRQAIEHLAWCGAQDSPDVLRTALQALGTAADPEVREVIPTLKSALEQAELLQKPNWELIILEILRDDRNPRIGWLPWAMRVASHRNLLAAKEVLETRLGLAEDKAHRQFREISRVDADVSRFGDVFASSDSLLGREDDYDDLLLTYWKLGGTLNALQDGRLKYFGYLGDPLSCLEALSDAKPR